MLVLLALLEGEADRALFLEFHERYERKLYTVALNILRISCGRRGGANLWTRIGTPSRRRTWNRRAPTTIWWR